MKISFIIPCLNAASIIENSLKKLTNILRKMDIKTYELILMMMEVKMILARLLRV